jgi:predicted ester cyclase
MLSPASEPRPADDRLARVREYYACFNERRFADAAALFTPNAVVEQMPLQCRERGGAAYQQFAELWTRAFPDVVFTVEGVAERAGSAIEIQLTARGTHVGDLTMGGCVFKPTGVEATLRMRELLQFEDDRIALSCLSFDLQELAQQLARVDDTQLLVHLSRLRYMEEQLRAASDSSRRLEVLDRIGRELDAARRVVRPYFGR